jgi:tripartite-type tricarboxylate transporter receptor subunit TctC
VRIEPKPISFICHELKGDIGHGVTGTLMKHAVNVLLWVLSTATLTILRSITTAHAQPAVPPYPSQSIRMIVPWPAGGTTDVVARLLAQSLTSELGQPVVVDNIAGAGGNIGTQQFVRAKQDGHSLLMASSSTNAANPHLYKNLGFEPIRDFVPIALIARVPSVLVVGADSPFRSLRDILDAARAKPDSLSYASAGVGSSAHLAGELLKSLAKIGAVHIPYKGIAPAYVDVMSGRITYTFDTGVSSNIEGGKLRALAVATSTRVQALPDVPTFDELGVKGMIMDVWFGVAGPANMSVEAVSKVNAATNKVIARGDLPQRLRKLGSDVSRGTPESFAEFWRNEVIRYGGIVSLSGAKLD